MTTIKFSEAHDLTEAQINTERRQIQGVVLIRAGMSKNKRDYPAAMLEQSVKVFEGSKAYDNHAQGARSIRDISGWYSNVRYQEGKLIADRHFAETGAGNDAWAIAKAVMSGEAPKNLAGLSINAVGTAKKHATIDGAVEIESITAAVSVDDVSEAAAGGSYRESANDDLTAAFWESVTFEEWRDSRSDYLERMKKHWQTIKRDDELTAALTENKNLKAELSELQEFRAAKVEMEKSQTALTEAQAEIKTLTAKHDSVVAELATTHRELAVDAKLKKANVPSAWLPTLRESLLKAEQSEWAGLIESEETKAKSAGHRIPVIGAGQQVNPPLKEAVKSNTAKPVDMTGIEDPRDLMRELQRRHS